MKQLVLPILAVAVVPVSEIVYPLPIGIESSTQWCVQGVPGGLHNTLKKLFGHDIRPVDAQRMRDRYFGYRNNVTYTTQIEQRLFNFSEAGPYRSSPHLLRQNRLGNNNLISVAKILPVFRDILDLSSHLLVGERLRLLGSRICSAMQSEIQVMEQDTEPPFSCALVDAALTGVVCGDSADTIYLSESEPGLELDGFPDAMCKPLESTLQHRADIGPFFWNDTKISLFLGLQDLVDPERPVMRELARLSSFNSTRRPKMDEDRVDAVRRHESLNRRIDSLRNVDSRYMESFGSRTPQLIPSRIRDSEILTYLALYRGIRLIYRMKTVPNMREAFDQVQLIPGWPTQFVIVFLQPDRRMLERQKHERFQTETPSWSLAMVNKHIAKGLQRLGSWLKIGQLANSEFPPFNDPSLFFIDQTTVNAIHRAIKDLRHLLTDPISSYHALADVFNSIALPYMKDSSADGAEQSSWSFKRATTFVHDIFRATVNEVRTPSKESGGIARVPAVFVSAEENEKCEIAIGIRGTVTFLEWLTDFSLWQTPDPVIDDPSNEHLSHRGVLSVTLAILPPLRIFLEEHTRKYGCSCQETRLIFYGHSLGAAVAEGLALRIGEVYRRAGCQLGGLDAVLFAPLKHQSEASKAKLEENVNLRVILDVSDPLSYIPCSGDYGFPRCGTGHLRPSGAGSDTYAAHGGIVWLSVDFDKEANDEAPDSPKAPKNMFELISANLLPTSLHKSLPTAGEIVAAHVCSHSCALSAGCEGGGDRSFRWWCDAECPAERPSLPN